MNDLLIISKHKIQDIALACGKVYKLLKTRLNNHIGKKRIANSITGGGN